jgi:hypothetical protein
VRAQKEGAKFLVEIILVPVSLSSTLKIGVVIEPLDRRGGRSGTKVKKLTAEAANHLAAIAANKAGSALPRAA